MPCFVHIEFESLSRVSTANPLGTMAVFWFEWDDDDGDSENVYEMRW